jgi:hypothetical protein
LRIIGITVVGMAALAGAYTLGSYTGDDAEGARLVRLERALNEASTSALAADQAADDARAHADDLETELNGTHADLDKANLRLNEAQTAISRLRAQQKRAEAAKKLSPADLQRAIDYAKAISTECLQIAKGKMPTDAQMSASADAIWMLPELLRRDPDTYYRFPDGWGRQTMRQLVGWARDMMAQGHAAPCNEFGAREFNTALETLPQ